jgi:CBS domain-containing protein
LFLVSEAKQSRWFIGGLPVMDEAGQLVGVLSEGDLLRRSETGASGTARDGSKSRRDPHGSRASTLLGEVARLMGRRLD